MPELCYTIDKGQGKAKSKTDERDEDLNRKEVSGLGTSDMIARFIQAELEEANGVLELQRSDLAQRFGCVPSQINYVMSTRFSPEHGYIVESRRGGGGYIRITRVQVDRHTLLMHVINSVGDTLDLASARPSCPTWFSPRPWTKPWDRPFCGPCPTIPSAPCQRRSGIPCGPTFSNRCSFTWFEFSIRRQSL